MPYRASRTFSGDSEVYSFLNNLESEDYRITGSFAKIGPHPETRRRLFAGESLEMDLDDAYEQLTQTPRTNYKVSLSYEEDPQVSVTARIGIVPSLTVTGSLTEFDSFNQFQEFLEEGEDWT